MSCHNAFKRECENRRRRRYRQLKDFCQKEKQRRLVVGKGEGRVKKDSFSSLRWVLKMEEITAALYTERKTLGVRRKL